MRFPRVGGDVHTWSNAIKSPMVDVQSNGVSLVPRGKLNFAGVGLSDSEPTDSSVVLAPSLLPPTFSRQKAYSFGISYYSGFQFVTTQISYFAVTEFLDNYIPVDGNLSPEPGYMATIGNGKYCAIASASISVGSPPAPEFDYLIGIGLYIPSVGYIVYACKHFVRDTDNSFQRAQVFMPPTPIVVSPGFPGHGFINSFVGNSLGYVGSQQPAPVLSGVSVFDTSLSVWRVA